MNAAREPDRRYETLLELGSGGMATVFVGRARGAAGFSRLVALKRARAHIKRDPKLFAALEREARLASRIHHSNVVGVVDVVEDEGDLVLVLEYVEGVSLAELAGCGDRAFSSMEIRARARAVVRIVLDVAAGLDVAHRTEDDDGRLLGIVHRDVSPANVLVGTDGVAKIADFGIAKSFEAHGDRTETDALKGKVGYMAPEYIEHHSSTPAGDLFALGVVAWESLTDTRLFRSATEIETLKRIVAGRVPELGSVAPELAPLDPVVRRALAVRPDERHRTVAAFAAELEAVARAHDLVASHAEVADAVTRAFGEMLAERRRRLSRPSSGPVSRPPPRGRDDIATASFGGSPSPRESAREDATRPDLPGLPRPRRGRPLVLGGAVVALLVVAALLALVAVLARAPAREETAPPMQGSSPPAAIPAAAPPSSDPARPADRAPTEPAASTTPATSASARKPAPPRVLVPRKAPPNPYLR